MVTKILIPSIMILVILFLLLRKKEDFKVIGTLELTFSPLNSIFLISNDVKYIEQSVKGTKIYKTKNMIYSNKTLYSESGEFSGFIFSTKPNQRFHIGFSNLEEDPKDKISHGINVIDDGVFEIVEKVKGTEEYMVQDLDYCLSGDLKECLKTKNKFTFNPNNNFLAIIFNNNIANYLVVTRNDDGNYGSILIHKGKLNSKFPYNIKVISNDVEVLLPTLLWTKHNYVYDSPVYWNVETSFKDVYDNKVLDVVPMPTQIIESDPIPAPTLVEDGEIDFGDAFGPGKRGILITNIKVDGEFYQVEYSHNLDDLYLKLNENRIFLKLYTDEDTYIFRKYPDLDSIDIFRNRQNIYALEIVIGDVVSEKYVLNESNISKIDKSLLDNQGFSISPSPN